MDGMHIFGGQLLLTPRGTFSELLTRGSSLRLMGDTRLTFNGDSAELVQGGVALNTSTRFWIHTGCAEVTPLATATVRYTVQLQDKTVYVTAEQGDVTVRSRKATRVSAGKTAAVYCGAAGQNIVVVGGGSLPANVAMGAASAGAAGAATLARKQDMSSSTVASK